MLNCIISESDFIFANELIIKVEISPWITPSRTARHDITGPISIQPIAHNQDLVHEAVEVQVKVAVYHVLDQVVGAAVRVVVDVPVDHSLAIDNVTVSTGGRGSSPDNHVVSTHLSWIVNCSSLEVPGCVFCPGKQYLLYF